MKKLSLVLLIGLFLSPLQMFADHYECNQLKPLHKPVAKSPTEYLFTFDLDYYTGDLTISFDNAIYGMYLETSKQPQTMGNT